MKFVDLAFPADDMQEVYLALCLADNEYRKNIDRLDGVVDVAADLFRAKSTVVQRLIAQIEKHGR